MDLLPLDTKGGIGLITRALPAGGSGLALVGGGIYLDETIDEAAARHLQETLGEEVRFAQDLDWNRPDAVGQYMRVERAGLAHDSRKHAIAVTYIAPILGTPIPRGEAIEFDWFDIDQLPRSRIGFGQEIVLDTLEGSMRERVARGTPPSSKGEV